MHKKQACFLHLKNKKTKDDIDKLGKVTYNNIYGTGSIKYGTKRIEKL